MKTKEELAQLAITISRTPFDSDTPSADILHHLMDIQLDAFKAGMRKAATLTCDYVHADYNVAVGIEQAILTAAEQLTIKDV